jgi:hypothetical protein
MISVNGLSRRLVEGGEQSVPDPAIIQLVATPGGASSPARERLSQIVQQLKAKG